MCIKQIVEISKALLTPLIAMVTVYIAWQQWKTNRQKLNLDRYDRRLHVYEEVRRILSIIGRDGKVSTEDLFKFYTSVSEADFLLGPEIRKYIDEIYSHCTKLGRWNAEYRDRTQEKPEDYDHGNVVDEKRKELKWLIDQFGPAKEIFRKYLDLRR